MSTLTARLAQFATTLRFEDIPDGARGAARRLIFDSLGCSLGGLKQHDPGIYLDVVRELGGNPQATVLGTGTRLSVVQATLINSLLVRVMDYNDIYWMQDPSHPSDIIPAALSTGEYVGANGQELLTAIVIGYEIAMRLCEFAFPGIRERGWHHATLTQFASPFVAGRILGLTKGQMVHAAGICGSSHATTGSVAAGKLTMMKNTADPMATAAGVESALLARSGYTGPEHVIDGKEGLMHCLGEGWKPDALTSGLGSDFHVTRCGMKAFPTEALTHAPITALLNIIAREALTPDQIQTVTVRTIARAADILSDPSKYNPRSKETADHSLPWCLAAACARGKVTPAEFTSQAIDDPLIRSFLARIHVLAEPSYEAMFPEKQPNHVTVTTRSNKSIEEFVEFPRGHWTSPLDRPSLLQKFGSLAAPDMDSDRVQAVYDCVMEFEQMDSIAPLLSMLRVRE